MSSLELELKKQESANLVSQIKLALAKYKVNIDSTLQEFVTDKAANFNAANGGQKEALKVALIKLYTDIQNQDPLNGQGTLPDLGRFKSLTLGELKTNTNYATLDGLMKNLIDRSNFTCLNYFGYHAAQA